MFRRVLFPTDLSAYAKAVFNCLPELSAVGMRQVVLLGIIHQDQVISGSTVDSDRLDRLRWEAEQELLIAQEALAGHGFEVKTRLEVGLPATEIVRVALEEHVHLITMGAQGKSLVRELLLGSVAQEVLHHAPVPVLIQKFEVVRQLGTVQCRRMCDRLFQQVLHPTDFSDCADAAFDVVKRLKEAGTEEVILLHVQDERAMRHRPPEQLVAFDQEDAGRLEQMRRLLALKGLSSRALLRHGIPFVETLKAAEEQAASLIVMGVRGRSAVAEAVAGSTSENVVRRSQRPVLVVRRQTAEIESRSGIDVG